MSQSHIFFLAVLVSIFIGLFYIYQTHRLHSARVVAGREITTVADLQRLFVNDTLKVQLLVDESKDWAQRRIQKLLNTPDAQRTFANTAQVLDDINWYVNSSVAILDFLKCASPDALVRSHAGDAFIELQEFIQEHISQNIDIFRAFIVYANGPAQHESLSVSQRYFIQETLQAYKRAGLFLKSDQLERVKNLYKELRRAFITFNKNICSVDTNIICTREELVGLPDSIMANLERDERGRYIIDSPASAMVLSHVSHEKTREKVYVHYTNRGFSANVPVLKEIFNVASELAHVLGFESYTAYALEDQMAKTVPHVQKFLNDLTESARILQGRELSALGLAGDVKIKPWDLEYLKEQYRQKNFNIDETIVSQYFPVQQVIAHMLELFGNFLGLSFERIKVNLWHESVMCFAVRGVHDRVPYGYLLFDLFARTGKRVQSAFSIDVVPARQKADGKRQQAVVIVFTNFAQQKKECSGLLSYDELKTLFHEFGHAVYGIVCNAQLAGFAEMNGKADFFEFPSQMFALWAEDASVLQKVSYHCATHQPMSEHMAQKLIASSKFGVGDCTINEIALSEFALKFFMGDVNKTPAVFYQTIMSRYRPYISQNFKDHMPFCWGFIADADYGPKYYSYLWSKAYACDVFSVIKRDGLFNPVLGQKLIKDVFAPGASCDQLQLLYKFLGREPDMHALARYLTS